MKKTFAVLAPAVLLAVFTPIAAHPEDVSWTNAIGVAVSGNSLTKTAAAAWGNAGAVSTAVLDWGPAYVEFTAGETSTSRMLGLSNGDSSQAYQDIDFAVYLKSTGELQVYEGGANKGTTGTYAPGDVLRVEAEPGVVRYRKNGVVFYTSTSAPRFPLLVDSALYTTGATLNQVVVGTSVFSRSVNVSIAGATLTKTGTSGWTGGAVSARRLEVGDGYAEFKAVETDTDRACGLGNGDGGQSVADIEFAVRLNADGTFEVSEGGISRGSFGSYAEDDVFRVEVRDGIVSYARNGELFYTSTVAPTYPLAVDTTLDQVEATLADISFVTLLWQNAAAVSVTGETLVKTGGDGWNAGASSTTSIADGDGWMEWTAFETNTDRIAGLSCPPAVRPWGMKPGDNLRCVGKRGRGLLGAE